MASRLNRAGIPVLDPPRNGLREKDAQKCAPGEHSWRRTERTRYDYSLGVEVTLYQCRQCPEDDWRPDREWRGF